MTCTLSFITVFPWYSKSVSATTCTARSSRKPRRKMPYNGKSRRLADFAHTKPRAVNDPLLNDNDIDTTDITTYVSCPVCFNSLMIRPEQLEKGPLLVNCNCCEKSTEVRSEELEDLDGTFDLASWRREYRSKQMTEKEIQDLQQYTSESFT